MQIPGDEVHTTLLEARPASLLDIGGSFSKLVGGELASPVGLDGLLDLTVRTWWQSVIEYLDRGTTGTACSPMRGKPRTLEETILDTCR